jgi:hypothetical protein
MSAMRDGVQVDQVPAIGKVVKVYVPTSVTGALTSTLLEVRWAGKLRLAGTTKLVTT